MSSPTSSMNAIRTFLACKRIALVGSSRDPKSFSATVCHELVRRGYDIVPVNPGASEVLGRRCFAHVQEIQPPVEAALLMTKPAVTDAVVRDCAEAGIHRVWMFRGGGAGAVSTAAVEYCRKTSIDVVAGECPLMFLPAPGPIHWIHGFIRKLMGTFPKSTEA